MQYKTYTDNNKEVRCLSQKGNEIQADLSRAFWYEPWVYNMGGSEIVPPIV